MLIKDKIKLRDQEGKTLMTERKQNKNDRQLNNELRECTEYSEKPAIFCVFRLRPPYFIHVKKTKSTDAVITKLRF